MEREILVPEAEKLDPVNQGGEMRFFRDLFLHFLGQFSSIMVPVSRRLFSYGSMLAVVPLVFISCQCCNSRDKS